MVKPADGTVLQPDQQGYGTSPGIGYGTSPVRGGGYCKYGCCYRGYGRCSRCCSYAEEAVQTQPGH